MGLSDLGIEVPVAKVQVADEFFTVRGLSPDDAMGLYYRHPGQLSALFEELSGIAAQTSDVDPIQLAMRVVSEAPRIMAEIIAVASGSDPRDDAAFEADVSIAIRLSAGVQADALKKVADLTFSSDMPPGKFLDLVLTLARSTQVAIGNQRA